jgi:hypothetical protein
VSLAGDVVVVVGDGFEENAKGPAAGFLFTLCGFRCFQPMVALLADRGKMDFRLSETHEKDERKCLNSLPHASLITT